MPVFAPGPRRAVLTTVQPGTNIAEHVEKEVAKAGLPSEISLEP
jgi:hypothetical protein